MNDFIRPNADIFQKIRSERNLIKQIKQDYEGLCEMWAMVKSGEADISETEIILQKLAWIKTALQNLKIQNNESIEGTYWGKIRDVESDTRNMERKLKTKGSVSNGNIVTFGEVHCPPGLIGPGD